MEASCNSCQIKNLVCGEKLDVLWVIPEGKGQIAVTMPPLETMVNDRDHPYDPTEPVDHYSMPQSLTVMPPPEPVPTLAPLLPVASTPAEEWGQMPQPRPMPDLDNSITNVWDAMMMDSTFQWEGKMVPEYLIEGRYDINWRHPLGGGGSGRVLEVLKQSL